MTLCFPSMVPDFKIKKLLDFRCSKTLPISLVDQSMQRNSTDNKPFVLHSGWLLASFTANESDFASFNVYKQKIKIQIVFIGQGRGEANLNLMRLCRRYLLFDKWQSFLKRSHFFVLMRLILKKDPLQTALFVLVCYDAFMDMNGNFVPSIFLLLNFQSNCLCNTKSHFRCTMEKLFPTSFSEYFFLSQIMTKNTLTNAFHYWGKREVSLPLLLLLLLLVLLCYLGLAHRHLHLQH